jgi:hypothetical protein
MICDGLFMLVAMVCAKKEFEAAEKDCPNVCLRTTLFGITPIGNPQRDFFNLVFTHIRLLALILQNQVYSGVKK